VGDERRGGGQTEEAALCFMSLSVAVYLCRYSVTTDFNHRSD